MTHNRAIEFLTMAKSALHPVAPKPAKARVFLEIAMSEVQELLDALAELEAQETVQCYDGVLIVSNIVTQDTDIAIRQEKRLQGFLGVLGG